MTLREIFDEIERRAEANMLKTGKLEGSHYASMRQVREELGVGRFQPSDTADNMQTNIEPPVMTAEANDSRTASNKAVVCKELLAAVVEVLRLSTTSSKTCRKPQRG